MAISKQIILLFKKKKLAMKNNQKLYLMRFLYLLAIIIPIVLFFVFAEIKWVRWSFMMFAVLFANVVAFPKAKETITKS